MAECFKTIRQPGEAELIVKKSRFIGRCFPVSDEGESASRLESVRKACWEATHNCYAYRIGFGGRFARSSDDGEPSGTAGAPMMNVLLRQDLTNVLCVVTRYFGGVLLGAGGLIRAYTDACAAAVANSGIVFMRSCTAYEMIIQYPQLSAAESAAAAYGGFEEKEFTDCVRAVIWVRDEASAGFLARIREMTDARVTPRAVAAGVRPFDA